MFYHKRINLFLGQSVEKKTSNSLTDHSTMQRKLRPFLGVWQATWKDDAAKCKSTLDLLPEDLSLSCFGEGKLTQRSKRQGYCFFCVCDAVFLVSFLPCQTPPPDHVHESLPDHFRPCPQNTWAPYYTAARDWLKPKGVSALTDRSGVVYWLSVNELRQYVCAIVAYVFLLLFFRSRLPASDHNFLLFLCRRHHCGVLSNPGFSIW